MRSTIRRCRSSPCVEQVNTQVVLRFTAEDAAARRWIEAQEARRVVLNVERVGEMVHERLQQVALIREGGFGNLALGNVFDLRDEVMRLSSLIPQERGDEPNAQRYTICRSSPCAGATGS
jgi:hypothetical protein